MQREGSERACLDFIGKPAENQTWKSTTFELMEWAANKNRETCFFRRLLIKLLRMECWRKNWLLKSGNLMNWWKWEQGDLFQPPGLFTEHTNKFIVNDDVMDCDTVAESEMSSISRSSLHRVNDRVRKIQNQSSKDATQDSTKHSFLIWECSCLRHWKHLYSWERTTQKIYIPSKIKGTISQWNRCSTYLKSW